MTLKIEPHKDNVVYNKPIKKDEIVSTLQKNCPKGAEVTVLRTDQNSAIAQVLMPSTGNTFQVLLTDVD